MAVQRSLSVDQCTQVRKTSDQHVCAVNDLFSRVFAVWTLTSCMLCLICARNPCNQAIYGKPGVLCLPAAYFRSAAHAAPQHHDRVLGSQMQLSGLPPQKCRVQALGRPAGATFGSFVLAFGYFLAELCLFRTLSLKRAAIAMSASGALRRAAPLASGLPQPAWGCWAHCSRAPFCSAPSWHLPA